jgi:transposase
MDKTVGLQTSNTETIVVSRAEYEELLGFKNGYLLLLEEVRRCKMQIFGHSSEKSRYFTDSNQLSMFDKEPIPVSIDVDDTAPSEVNSHTRHKRKNTVNDLPEGLPVEQIIHDLEDSQKYCEVCNDELHVLGRKVVRRNLKIIPAQIVVQEHIQLIYGCRNCEQNATESYIAKAPIPDAFIKGSYATPEAVAYIMHQKFVMGVPLYRQAQEFKRQSIYLCRQTMSNWLISCSQKYLEPVWILMREILVSNKFLQADETRIQVLREPGKNPRGDKWMWLYRTMEECAKPVVLMDYQASRNGDHCVEFLKGFKGTLQADGFPGYHKLEKQGVILVGCMAHCRRYYAETLKGLSKEQRANSKARIGFDFCNRLFDIESSIQDLTIEEKLKKRGELAKPILDQFFKWACEMEGKVSGKLEKAINYTLNQWKYLIGYLNDGRIEISNNLAERSIKPFCVGRRNFLFCTSPAGAKAAAIIFSLIEAAKANNIEPFRYLCYVLHNAPTLNLENEDEVRLLLPEGLKTW